MIQPLYRDLVGLDDGWIKGDCIVGIVLQKAWRAGLYCRTQRCIEI